MKISFIQFVISVFFVSFCNAHVSVGQKGLNERITLSVKNTSLKSLLKDIENLTDLSFSYQKEVIANVKSISFDCKNQPVKEVLNTILASNAIEMKVFKSNRIILVKKEREGLETNNIEEPLIQLARPIKGKVVDEYGKPLAGVSVKVKESAKGTTTRDDGTFNLNIEDKDKTLIFTFVGMNPIEQTVGGRTFLEVTMQEYEKKLDEVVIVGYGVQKKATSSGAISSINSKELKSVAAPNAAIALQGRIPGLQIYRGGGPLAGPRYFQLRGVGSLGVDSSPLVLVDGVPGDINAINPEQIEDISILKDATAAAVYGASAGGGIILITTKNGKEGRTKVSLSVKQGFNDFVNLLKPLSAYEQALLVNEARINAGLSPAWKPSQIDSLSGAGTNWIENVTRTGQTKEYNLQISGGTTAVNYLLSSNYIKEEGAVVGNWVERGNTRLKLNTNITPSIKLGLNIFGQFRKGRGGADLVSAAEYSSFIPKYLPDGRPGILNPQLAGGQSGGQASGINPLQVLDDSIRGYTNYSPTYNLDNILTAEIQLIDKLKFNTIFGYSIGMSYSKNFNQDYVVYDAIGQANGGAVVSRRLPGNRSASASFNYGESWNTQNYITFNDTFSGVHNLTAIVGFRSAKRNMGANLNGSRINFANNVVQNVGQGGGTGQSVGGSDNNPSTSYSYFGRLSYTQNNKYTLEGSMSYDGSDRFGPLNKFGLFGGFGASWRLSQENFFKERFGNIIDEMKLRTSYGIVGNDRIGQFLYYSAVNITGSAYTFGNPALPPVGGANQDGAILPNDGVKWETLNSFNIGTDISLNKNWGISIDWYNKITKNLLFQVPVSLTTGFGTQWQNIGNLSNKGIEMSITYNKKFGKSFEWNSRLIFSRNENKVTELFNGIEKYTLFDRAFVVGKSVSTIYGWKVLGIFESMEQINSTPHFGSPAPGDFIYEDINKDGKVDTYDYQPIGDAVPKGVFAWTNTFNWKNFDFNLHISADFGAQVSQGGEGRFMFAEGITRNNLQFLVGRWRGPGTSTNIPRVVVGNTYNASGARPAASNSVQNNDYLRVRQIELGYSLPSKNLSRLGISSFRVYANMINPFTFSSFYGWDPESGSNGQRYGFYPIYRTITFGVNLGI